MRNPFSLYKHDSNDPDVIKIKNRREFNLDFLEDMYINYDCASSCPASESYLSSKEEKEFMNLIHLSYDKCVDMYEIQRACYGYYIYLTEGPDDHQRLTHDQALYEISTMVALSDDAYIIANLHYCMSPKEAGRLAYLTRKMVSNMIEQAMAPRKDIWEMIANKN